MDESVSIAPSLYSKVSEQCFSTFAKDREKLPADNAVVDREVGKYRLEAEAKLGDIQPYSKEGEACKRQ